jgi:hypothetical protein
MQEVANFVRPNLEAPTFRHPEVLEVTAAEILSVSQNQVSRALNSNIALAQPERAHSPIFKPQPQRLNVPNLHGSLEARESLFFNVSVDSRDNFSKAREPFHSALTIPLTQAQFPKDRSHNPQLFQPSTKPLANRQQQVNQSPSSTSLETSGRVFHEQQATERKVEAEHLGYQRGMTRAQQMLENAGHQTQEKSERQREQETQRAARAVRFDSHILTSPPVSKQKMNSPSYVHSPVRGGLRDIQLSVNQSTQANLVNSPAMVSSRQSNTRITQGLSSSPGLARGNPVQSMGIVHQTPTQLQGSLNSPRPRDVSQFQEKTGVGNPQMYISRSRASDRKQGQGLLQAEVSQQRQDKLSWNLQDFRHVRDHWDIQNMQQMQTVQSLLAQSPFKPELPPLHANFNIPQQATNFNSQASPILHTVQQSSFGHRPQGRNDSPRGTYSAVSSQFQLTEGSSTDNAPCFWGSHISPKRTGRDISQMPTTPIIRRPLSHQFQQSQISSNLLQRHSMDIHAQMTPTGQAVQPNRGYAISQTIPYLQYHQNTLQHGQQQMGSNRSYYHSERGPDQAQFRYGHVRPTTQQVQQNQTVPNYPTRMEQQLKKHA